MQKPIRVYRIRDGVEAPPNYDRAVRALTDEELEDEILSRRGEAGYRLALLAEHERRGVPTSTTNPDRRNDDDND